MKDKLPSCASCPLPAEVRLCRNPEGKGPSSCPVRMEDLVEESAGIYEGTKLREFALQASLQEAPGIRAGPRATIPRFPASPGCWKQPNSPKGWAIRGWGWCSAQVSEKRQPSLTVSSGERGFQVVSVICKAGRIPKETIGVKDGEKIVPGTLEPMCNPVMQALVLNRAGTEFNIVAGLCVGHDSLFMMHSEAPCTVLVAKDRTSAHSPAAAIYTLEGYSRHLKERS